MVSLKTLASLQSQTWSPISGLFSSVASVSSSASVSGFDSAPATKQQHNVAAITVTSRVPSYVLLILWYSFVVSMLMVCTQTAINVRRLIVDS